MLHALLLLKSNHPTTDTVTHAITVTHCHCPGADQIAIPLPNSAIASSISFQIKIPHSHPEQKSIPLANPNRYCI
jgi:hypothetical protein